MGDVLSVHLEEFKALRTEIVERFKNQTTIVTASVALTGVATPALSFLPAKQLLGLLAIPLLSLVLGVFYLAQDAGIATAARYIDMVLKPRILRALSIEVDRSDADPILTWDSFHTLEIVRGSWAIRVTTTLGGVASVLPGTAVLVGAVVLLVGDDRLRSGMHGGEWALFGVDLVLYLGLAVLWAVLGLRYNALSVAPAESHAAGAKAENGSEQCSLPPDS